MNCTQAGIEWVLRSADRHPRRACGLRFRSGAKGNRTPDLFHAMEALYQLSYSPEGTPTVAPAVAGPETTFRPAATSEG